MPKKPKELSDVEVALVDAIKTVLEAVIYIKPKTADYFIKAFAHQRDEKLVKSQPEAAAALELLRGFVADPSRRKARERLVKLLREPPEGQA